ncbi:hypothetical protein CY34DRAFT_802566 [Suillus luteus UH-Slu-Lm8-n1]|uniref:Uncharacterized protein n=1 Tax=Suillus luteus UH-Slu-Lm8-n1 TaxID=930992 RepID=A0A0D0BMY5_9AGAM|nr:hypothetical protein CY34DRAFT_802566 [Suillus luteus UH-Slu-Lm8-n1]
MISLQVSIALEFIQVLPPLLYLSSAVGRVLPDRLAKLPRSANNTTRTEDSIPLLTCRLPNS